MPEDATLRIRQYAPVDGKYPIQLTLKRPGQPELEAEATIEFALTPQEQADLRWYLEDYLQRAESVERVQVEQIENLMKKRGEELYSTVLDDNQRTRAIWFAVREQLADLRIEITSGIAEAASIPWELMRDPQTNSAIALRVKAFVRVQSNPNISFVKVPKAHEGRVRLLYIVCRPSGRKDVELRAVANRLLQGLGEDRARYDITALRPPTFEALQKELKAAKKKRRPYHIVHFDGHGVYAELKDSVLKDWLAALNHLTLGGKPTGKHGFLLFENPESEYKMRPVDGQTLGQLLHDTGVPILALNACQSAMHEANAPPADAESAQDEIRVIGSLAQTVVDQGIPAVLGMRYSVFVVTAAQYIGELYRSLAKGSGFGEAASEGRKHLHLNPERWIGLKPRPLQDWFVPVVYEAMPLSLLHANKPLQLGEQTELDPVQINQALLRYVPDHGFVGRDETLLMLDRAFDDHPVVLLHAYAGQGKTTTAVEFARWYAQTGGLGPRPIVLFTSFEKHTDLNDILNQIGQKAVQDWNVINEIEEKRKVAVQLLRQVPVLWIWDNVELVAGFPEGTESQWTAGQQQDLADFLKQLKLDKATKVKILLTSRRDEQKWLGGIPHRVQIPRMSSADAAGLVLRLGEAKKLTRSDIAKWQPLLDYCDGNPLTLRVLVGQAVKENRREEDEILKFVEAIRSGEKDIQDENRSEGRDKSLGASLDYGFRNAFTEDELPIIALLHLFQGTVDVVALLLMGEAVEHVLPEVKGKSKEYFTGLLERAADSGLLTQIGPAYFSIHPALAWFLGQLFARHYDGQNGRSNAEAALRAWVEAVCALGTYCFNQFNEGNRDVIQPLALEEANLLHARRLARRQGWWDRVISAMQGLYMLYQYWGRLAEWARLVDEIVPDYCTEDDEPVPSREDQYSMVMGYRIELVQKRERNLIRAAELREKVVAWDRRQASTALALPENAPLNDKQRNCIRTLAVSLEALGRILSEQDNCDCVEQYEEAIRLSQRINDTAHEAIVRMHLGHAYKDIPAIRDLDAAEAAYKVGFALHQTSDLLGRSQCIGQIGVVQHERYSEARQHDEPSETLLRHAQAAEEHYRQALDLCPTSAIAYLGTAHGLLGSFYRDVGQMEHAREHYEKATQYFEQTADRHNSGKARHNMALMYYVAAVLEETPSRQRDTLLRARAYAQAALRDFLHYKGRAAADEAKAQQLIDDIAQSLAKLPQ